MLVFLILIFIIRPFRALGESSDDFVDYRLFPPAHFLQQDDTIRVDTTIDLKYPFEDYELYPATGITDPKGLFLKKPSNIRSEIEYDPETDRYIFREKIGDLDIRPPSYLSVDEYLQYDIEHSVREYWNQRAAGVEPGTDASFMPQFNVGGEAFDKIFGSNTINITPQGSAELIFKFNMSRIDNPTLSEKLRKTPSFDFDERIQMNVAGTIGDKLELGVNYNTEATFEFENKTKLEYEGDEDEILKKIEAGNVTLPLSGSLITGSQSLFGLKTEMQFGKLTVTNVFSQQKGETSVIEVQGGAQVNDYELYVDEYEANKHFFLAQYFYENYDNALKNLPVINSGITINKIEVWVTNKSGNYDNARNVVAFLDLAEPSSDRLLNDQIDVAPGARFPANESNDLYNDLLNLDGARDIGTIANSVSNFKGSMTTGRDFEKIENARLLTQREYTLHPKLGYISLNTSLNSDEILAVAFEYTVNGKTYRVGELSNSSGVTEPDALVLKLLKGTNLTPSLPNWRLMMKNIYAIGAYQINREDFIVNILYEDDQKGAGVNYISEGEIKNEILLRVFNLDRLNQQLDPKPDGVFDFVEGLTVDASGGRIIFPMVEPFGNYLADKFKNKDLAEKYAFPELYDETQTRARQIAEKNKFKISGTYKSAVSSEIMLNAMNVPQGSVKVTAGGRQLTENIDYTVDYTLGRVKIINTGLLESGSPIRVSLENNSLFNIQTKTLLGTHLDYRISEDFNIGATVLNLTERPLTQKVNIGDEPISNTIWGLNGTYRTKSQFLTNMVDRIPLIDTKEESNIMVEAEFAHLIPGSSKAIGRNGVAFIDDFEGSETSIEMKTFSAWSLASTPQGQNDLFPEASEINRPEVSFNRAKISWYVIDPLFLRDNSLTPSHITDEDQSSFYVREFYERDIWPNKESPNNVPTNLSLLNVAYYPEEKGPYNYDVLGGRYSSGINENGLLNEPGSRWGGIMREVLTNDFEAANVEFIEFWLMDPFVEDSFNQGGNLYFNLGNVSEDILRDGRKAFENGLPAPGEDPALDTTAWGVVPRAQMLVNAFDTDPAARSTQDVGLDGLSSIEESEFFRRNVNPLNPYLDIIDSLYDAGFLTEEAYLQILEDPSNDDYHYYRGSNYDRQQLGILERYKKYNGMEGNSPVGDQTDEDYLTTGSSEPDKEDINRDNTLSEGESYFQYVVPITPSVLNNGHPYIRDVVKASVQLENGKKGTVNWYQFRIPVREGISVNGIQDFKSIRFMRMFMRGFEKTTIFRFAKLELVRGEWRKYDLSFLEGGEGLSEEEPDGQFDISAVNIEENAGKSPVNYVLPPGVDRVIDPANTQLRQLNEQAMVMKVLELAEGDARAAYKNLLMDMRQYQMLRMEVHGEAIEGYPLEDGDLTVFIRLGTDYKNNYYEYEVPLHLTPPKPPEGYDNDSESDRRIVWPEENSFDIKMDIFLRAKQARNDEMRRAGSEITYNTKYPMADGQNMAYVVGNPNLSNVRTIMIGIRNPRTAPNGFDNDGLPKSVEIWVNELRLTDFNDMGGWAANARAAFKLADFGTVSVAGSTLKPGFGSIEQKVNERSKEEINTLDVSTNLQLGKFFPEKAGVNIPMYMGYSTSVINPQYNPLDPDIPLKAALQNAETRAEKEEIKDVAQDVVTRKSLNFTNVSMRPQGQTRNQPRFYDISNWSADYSYNEMNASNFKTEYDNQVNYRGGLAYNFTTRPKPVQPLGKVKSLNSPYLKIIKDFNFYYMPQSFSFRTDLDRTYRESKLKNLYSDVGQNVQIKIDSTIFKDFRWNRYYDVKYDLTRSLKIDFSATNIALIDEPDGAVDKNYWSTYEAWKDSVWDNLSEGGRTTSYYHNLRASYNIPINKIPLFNWVTATARYEGSYGWDVSPEIRIQDEVTGEDLFIEVGNTINNSNRMQGNGNLNLQNLYNKVGFIKRIEDKSRASARGRKEVEMKTVTYEDEIRFMTGGYAKSIFHKLKTEDVSVKFYDENGNEVNLSVEVINENKVRVIPDQDLRNLRVVVEGQVKKRENPLIFIAENSVRLLTGLKRLSVDYSQTNGTILPGYTESTYMLGMNRGFMAPGWPFIAGWTDEDFGEHVARQGWLSKDSFVTQPYTLTYNDNFTVRGRFEPFKGFTVDLNANRIFARNSSVDYFYDYGAEDYVFDQGQLITGNFSMSTITLKTAFENPSPDNKYESEAFDNFKLYRQIVSHRQGASLERLYPQYDPDAGFIDNETGEFMGAPPGYSLGYGPTSQEVLMPAFLSAYSGADPQKASLDMVPSIMKMLPNWQVRFDGLSNIEFIKKYLRSVNVNHAYRSTYSIGAFSNNPEYFGLQDGNLSPEDQDRDFGNVLFDALNPVSMNLFPEFDVAAVSINEQFSPLLGFDMNWLNSLTTRIEMRRSRTIALSLINNQITEVLTRELVIGAGYRFSEVELNITTGGGTSSFSSDLNVRADVSIKNNLTILRKLTEGFPPDVSSGERQITVDLSADYMLSDKFNLRLFFRRDVNTPYVSLYYPRANTEVGFSVRFTLIP